MACIVSIWSIIDAIGTLCIRRFCFSHVYIYHLYMSFPLMLQFCIFSLKLADIKYLDIDILGLAIYIQLYSSFSSCALFSGG